MNALDQEVRGNEHFFALGINNRSVVADAFERGGVDGTVFFG